MRPSGSADSDINDTEFSDYHCSIEWHLAKLKTAPFSAILYPFAYRISKASGRFHCSAVRLAGHFKVSRWTVLRALQALEEAGLFVLIAKELFKSSVYKVVSHTDWAAANPGACAVKATYPWSGEDGDKLGVRLHNASGGRVKYQPHKLAALRKTGLTDDEIVNQFEEFAAHENARRRRRWKSASWRFLRRVELLASNPKLGQLASNLCKVGGYGFEDENLAGLLRLLRQYPGEEIEGAYKEYIDSLNGRGMRRAPTGFIEGGADAVLLARRNRLGGTGILPVASSMRATRPSSSGATRPSSLYAPDR